MSLVGGLHEPLLTCSSSSLFLTAFVLMHKENNLGHGDFFFPFFGHGKIFWAMGFFSWAMAKKVAMGEKTLPMGKMVKC